MSLAQLGKSGKARLRKGRALGSGSRAQEARAPAPQLGALSHAWPGTPSRAAPGAIREPGECSPRRSVPTTPRHPPAGAPVPSAPPPPAARPVPEAETDPGPAPLSSTAPGRVHQGEGGRQGRPLAWPASAPGPGRPQVTPAEDPARGVGLELERQGPEMSRWLGGERAGGTPEESASSPLPTRGGRTRFGKVERLPGWGQREPLLPSRGQAALEAPVSSTPYP